MDNIQEMSRIEQGIMDIDVLIDFQNMESDFIKYTMSIIDEESLKSIEKNKKKSIDFIFAKIKTEKFLETAIIKQLSTMSLDDVEKMSDETSHKIANDLLTAVKKFSI